MLGSDLLEIGAIYGNVGVTIVQIRYTVYASSHPTSFIDSAI